MLRWLLGAGPSGLGEPWPWPGPAPTWPDLEAKWSDVEEFLKESEKARKIRQRSPRRPFLYFHPTKKIFWQGWESTLRGTSECGQVEILWGNGYC